MKESKGRKLLAYILVPVIFSVLGYGFLGVALKPVWGMASAMASFVLSDEAPSFDSNLTSIYDPEAAANVRLVTPDGISVAAEPAATETVGTVTDAVDTATETVGTVEETASAVTAEDTGTAAEAVGTSAETQSTVTEDASTVVAAPAATTETSDTAVAAPAAATEVSDTAVAAPVATTEASDTAAPAAGTEASVSTAVAGAAQSAASAPQTPAAPYVDIADVEFPITGTQYGLLTNKELGLNAPVYWDDTNEIMRYGAGQFIGSFLPGFGRVIVLSGHNVTHFAPLEFIKVGDVLDFGTNYGNYQYKVTKIEILNERDLDTKMMEMIPEEKETLVLYTCYPFTAISGRKTDRITVFCDRIAGPDVKWRVY